MKKRRSVFAMATLLLLFCLLRANYKNILRTREHLLDYKRFLLQNRTKSVTNYNSSEHSDASDKDHGFNKDSVLVKDARMSTTDEQFKMSDVDSGMRKMTEILDSSEHFPEDFILYSSEQLPEGSILNSSEQLPEGSILNSSEQLPEGSILNSSEQISEESMLNIRKQVPENSIEINVLTDSTEKDKSGVATNTDEPDVSIEYKIQDESSSLNNSVKSTEPEVEEGSTSEFVFQSSANNEFDEFTGVMDESSNKGERHININSLVVSLDSNKVDDSINVEAPKESIESNLPDESIETSKTDESLSMIKPGKSSENNYQEQFNSIIEPENNLQEGSIIQPDFETSKTGVSEVKRIELDELDEFNKILSLEESIKSEVLTPKFQTEVSGGSSGSELLNISIKQEQVEQSNTEIEFGETTAEGKSGESITINKSEEPIHRPEVMEKSILEPPVDNQNPQLQTIDKSRPYVPTMDKPRPTLQTMYKSRPNLQTMIKSRPNLDTMDKSRPNLQTMDKSRPNVQTMDKPRPHFKLIWDEKYLSEYIRQCHGKCKFISIPRRRGRMGNNMFQIASMIGTADDLDLVPIIVTKFDLNKYFKLPNLIDMNISNEQICIEKGYGIYSSCLGQSMPMGNTSFTGFRQSWKYFANSEKIVRTVFKFRPKFINDARSFHKSLYKPGYKIVGIHIRRGDITAEKRRAKGNGVAEQGFFRNSMKYYTNLYKNVIFVILSDDKAWCKKNIRGPNVKYSHFTNPGNDMALMTLLDGMILTYGTFGWWGAWLSGKPVVYFWENPRPGSRGAMNRHREDYYPNTWIPMSNSLM